MCLGESNVLPYFINMKYNSVVPDAFSEFSKVMNHNGWEILSSTDTHLI